MHLAAQAIRGVAPGAWVFSKVFVAIPYSMEQGILKCEHGMIAPEERIFFEQQRNCHWPHWIG